jgi:pyruvate,water dikinase
MNRDGFLDLAECGRDDVGGKARRLGELLRLRPSLFAVPPGFLVRAWVSLESGRGALEAALDRLGPGPYAVRSNGMGEDTADRSQAGRYQTVLNVDRGGIRLAIDEVRRSLAAAGDPGDVLVQPMVRASIAGVVFSRSPHDPGLAVCEYAEGGAEMVVSGRGTPRSFTCGRWTGRLEPEPEARISGILRLVFLVGSILEGRFGRPQDVEWAWDDNARRLVVLQSRNVTATAVSQHIEAEQDRLVRLALASRRGRQGRPVFTRAGVNEVVRSPTRLTRSLIERLYSPAGALGRGLSLLGLPAPSPGPSCVTSAFGRLVTNVEVEQRWFGLRPGRWWAVRRLRRRIRHDRSSTLEWMRGLVAAMPAACPGDAEAHAVLGWTAGADRSIGAAAGELARRARWFIEAVYPTAYAATILAQLAGETAEGGSRTARLLGDLSALHHAGDQAAFLARWGHRSANDYELAEPRFAEAPETAWSHARAYAALAWAPVEEAGAGFVELREEAKDRAIRSLGAVRDAALELNRVLGMAEDAAFFLDLAEVEEAAAGNMDREEIGRRLDRYRVAERDWSMVDLGEAVGLREIERLGPEYSPQERLRGRMVSVARGFRGEVRRVDEDPPPALHGGEVLLTRYLEPRLAGWFPLGAGCIADHGGSLSHAAIVARELGRPVLILPGSTGTLRDGDHVVVEADGTITVTRGRR